ncbi:MAG TPA: DivIVA domain-containing protein [Thermodesulfobacteriota bacterium]|nr:DivIVA domain-containing protein [Thermodesulfobacteriota bacterium]
MKITPLEIRGFSFKKSIGGYNQREVDRLKEQAAEALEEANRTIMLLEERLKDTGTRLNEHIKNENLLKEAITTTHKMAGDIKEGAKKEAELTLAEAKMRAEDIIRQAQSRATKFSDEIHRLKKQRAEIESSIKAVLDYHSTKLLIEEEESQRADTEAEKIKYLLK